MAERTGCKIETVCASRGLRSLADRLVDRRVDTGESLRDLERFFNQEVLAAAMRAAGMELLEGEAANVYRLLTDDDVSDAARREAEDRLRRAGVDIDAVRDGFVTYGTVRTHLRECVGVETARESTVDAAAVRDTAFGLFGRAEAITERELSRLAETESFDAGEVAVSLTARVTCETCGEEYGLLRLLDRGGCGCERGREDSG